MSTPSDVQRATGPRAAFARRAPELGAALAGLGWFLALGGFATLDPRHLDWLNGGDWRQHVLGWLFFRASPWRFPLGSAPAYAWPVGGTVAMTDANPWVAVLAKVASPALPVDFQYLGPWLALSFALQGWVGARLVGLASRAPAHRFLGGALFVLSPALTWRVGHDTLCAQWILLAFLVLLLGPAPDAAAGRRAGTRAALLVALASGIHPYLLAMAIVLGGAVLVRLARERVLRGAALATRAVATALVPAATALLFGYVPGPPTIAHGFGEFSADALALVNPMGRARFLPALPLASVAQGEGFAYLGLGGLALLCAALVLALARPGLARRAPVRRLAFAASACALLALFALSQQVTVAGRPVLNLYGFYKHFMNVTGPLRASGRFVWPLHDLLLLAGAGGVAALAPARTATLLLAAGVAVQGVDMTPALEARLFAEARWRPTSPTWELARGRYDLVAVYPANVFGTDVGCRRGDWAVTHWPGAAYVAYRLGASVNSGYLSRLRGAASESACAIWDREIQGGLARTRTIYVVEPRALPEVARIAGVTCGRLDDLDVCVRAARDDAFAAALAASRPRP